MNDGIITQPENDRQQIEPGDQCKKPAPGMRILPASELLQQRTADPVSGKQQNQKRRRRLIPCALHGRNQFLQSHFRNSSRNVRSSSGLSSNI